MRWTDKGHMEKIRNIYSKSSPFRGATFLKSTTNSEMTVIKK
jgi:hypothetical protein